MYMKTARVLLTWRKSEDSASLRYSLDSSIRTEEWRICRNSSRMKWRAWLWTHCEPWGSELQDRILTKLSRDSPSAMMSSQPTQNCLYLNKYAGHELFNVEECNTKRSDPIIHVSDPFFTQGQTLCYYVLTPMNIQRHVYISQWIHRSGTV